MIEIREDPIFTPYCTDCRTVVSESVTSRRAAEVAATVHELNWHPEPEMEDA